MVDGSAFWPGVLVFLAALLFAVVVFLGFGVALWRGVRNEQRSAGQQGGRGLTP